AQLFAIDQPVGLRVAPHQRRRQQRQLGLHTPVSMHESLKPDGQPQVSRLATVSASARSRSSYVEPNSERLLLPANADEHPETRSLVLPNEKHAQYQQITRFF